MDLFPEESFEDELGITDDLKNEVLEFVTNFDATDGRDPYYTAELIYSVPEETIKKWVRERATLKLKSALNKHKPEIEANIATITESLKLIKKSMLKLEEHNKKLIQKWKENKKKSDSDQ